jgi:K+-sensing histidine kinase KdpD
MIVQSLTEAAHIDEALLQDENEIFDLAAMVSEYVANSKLKHGSARIKYKGPESGIFISGSGLRIAQLMDKVKDNALDFAAEGSQITIELTREHDKAKLSVTNYGPVVPDEVLGALFTGITSSRTAEQDQPHLGIGLYIANRIAQQHGGELKIMNLYNLDGVKVMLSLPVAGPAC